MMMNYITQLQHLIAATTNGGGVKCYKSNSYITPRTTPSLQANNKAYGGGAVLYIPYVTYIHRI